MIEAVITTVSIVWVVCMLYILVDMAIVDHMNNKEYRKRVKYRGW